MISELVVRVKALLARVRRGGAVNVNDTDTKEAVIGSATDYFSNHRPEIVATLGETDRLLSCDRNWQELIRLAHGNNPRKSYVRLLADVLGDLSELSIATLSAGVSSEHEPSDGGAGFTIAEQAILTTLEALFPPAASSYRQGLEDLRGEPRHSYRGTACEFRECLRETLDQLAPDDDVSSSAGFKYDAGRTTPTMRQKVRFVMTSRGRKSAQRDVMEKTVRGVEDLAGEILRATYDRASLSTHLQTTREEVQRIKRYVDTVFFDLLEIAEPDL